jgi:hypothetical protein
MSFQVRLRDLSWSFPGPSRVRFVVGMRVGGKNVSRGGCQHMYVDPVA